MSISSRRKKFNDLESFGDVNPFAFKDIFKSYFLFYIGELGIMISQFSVMPKLKCWKSFRIRIHFWIIFHQDGNNTGDFFRNHLNSVFNKAPKIIICFGGIQ